MAAWTCWHSTPDLVEARRPLAMGHEHGYLLLSSLALFLAWADNSRPARATTVGWTSVESVQLFNQLQTLSILKENRFERKPRPRDPKFRRDGAKRRDFEHPQYELTQHMWGVGSYWGFLGGSLGVLLQLAPGTQSCQGQAFWLLGAVGRLGASIFGA